MTCSRIIVSLQKKTLNPYTIEIMKKHAPSWLSHKPVITVDYDNKDAFAHDAKFLSIGHANWDSEEFSAKIWRKTTDDERWSRQGEEMPLWRVLDLATLLVSVIKNKESNLNEFVQDETSIDALRDYINENMELYAPRLNELSRLLEPSTHSQASDNLPNIFSFATSELSQDAMFAYLMQWSDTSYKEKDKDMYSVANSFIRMLLGDGQYKVSTIKVGRQWQNIDLWAEINDDTFLIIEDKTNTSIHDNQLERYKEIVKKEYKGIRERLYYVYIKTGNEPLSVLKEIEKKGYKTISRKDIINCLNQYKGNNALLLNYIKHLEKIEEETQSFRKLPVSEWGWYAWQGFFNELDSRLSLTSWNYVSNPSGGFLGAWWHFTRFDEDGEMYLQFEEQKLCFKIYYEGERERSEVRTEMYERLLSIAGKNNYLEISRPTRFGAGFYMTIAIVDPIYLFGNSIVDIDLLINKLLSYQELIDICCKDNTK